MPFTIEQIKEAIKAHQSAYYETIWERMATSGNFPAITGYLTGKDARLGTIQQDNYNYYWGGLVHLLKDIAPPSPDDQLVLDLINDVDLQPYLINGFYSWLIRYVITNKSDAGLAGAQQQFAGHGLNTAAFFDYLINGIGQLPDSHTLLSGHPVLKSFLTQIISSSATLLIPKQGQRYYSSAWYPFYFMLLHEVAPERAKAYALYAVETGQLQQLQFITTCNGGQYLPYIIEQLKKEDMNPESIPYHFAAAMRLYTDGPTEGNLSIVQNLAARYLQYFNKHTPKQTYGGGFQLKLAEGEEPVWQPYTACAVHFLLLKDKEEAKAAVDGMFSGKVYVHQRILQIMHRHLGEAALPFYLSALKADTEVGGADYMKSIVNELAEKFYPAGYLPALWTLINHKSKPLRERVAVIIGEKDGEAETKAIALLQHKNAETRQTAAIILSHLSSATATEAIQQMLNKETNDATRDLLLQTVADSLPSEASYAIVEDRIVSAKSRGKLAKPAGPWLAEEALPPLFYKNGEQVSTEAVRFLLYRMSRIRIMEAEIEAGYVLQLMDKEKSTPFATAVLKLYSDNHYKPEHKYLLALAALLGDDSIADRLRIITNKWIDEARYKMAEYSVGALALQGSDKALRWVEWYSRKYKTKKANIGTAAGEALEAAATALGISTHELGDKIVPDFGFEGLFKSFTAAGEEYRAFIDSNFKIAFFNEDNKKLKAVPPATDAELKEEFKAIAKEVKDITRSQASRLEYYLIIQRKWSYEQWQAAFLQNPVMFIYATRLLWGVYDEKGNLTQTFICNEDTSLVDIAGDEIELADRAMIGIVHPMQLSSETLQQWKEQFFGLSIEPIFPQLERKVPDLSDYDLSKNIIRKFEGRRMKENSIKSTLEKWGWHKGPTGDGGSLESFNLLYDARQIEAILELEGVGVGYGWGGEEKLGRLYIISKAKTPQRWFNAPRTDDDERLMKWTDVPPIFLSEMFAAIEAIKPYEESPDKSSV